MTVDPVVGLAFRANRLGVAIGLHPFVVLCDLRAWCTPGKLTIAPGDGFLDRIFIGRTYRGLPESPEFLLLMHLLWDTAWHTISETRPMYLWPNRWHITQHYFWATLRPVPAIQVLAVEDVVHSEPEDDKVQQPRGSVGQKRHLQMVKWQDVEDAP